MAEYRFMHTSYTHIHNAINSFLRALPRANEYSVWLFCNTILVLWSHVLHSTFTTSLNNPLTLSWAMFEVSLTLLFIKTGDRGGTGGTHPQQQTIKYEGGTCGHPTLNNAHQMSGVCG